MIWLTPGGCAHALFGLSQYATAQVPAPPCKGKSRQLTINGIESGNCGCIPAMGAGYAVSDCHGHTLARSTSFPRSSRIRERVVTNKAQMVLELRYGQF